MLLAGQINSAEFGGLAGSKCCHGTLLVPVVISLGLFRRSSNKDIDSGAQGDHQRRSELDPAAERPNSSRMQPPVGGARPGRYRALWEIARQGLTDEQ